MAACIPLYSIAQQNPDVNVNNESQHVEQKFS